MVKFIRTTAEKFNAIETKDPDALYFLDNNTLYRGNDIVSNIVTVFGDFPNTDLSHFRNMYLIKPETGEIKYVNNNDTITDITSAIINKVLDSIPTLTIEGNTLIYK